MIHVAIVDDMPSSIEKLRAMLNTFAKEQHLLIEADSFSSGEAFLAQFTPHTYQIIFLDIFMDGIKGTEVAAKIRENEHQALIIFLTTSTDFMYDAFDTHAFQYIIKPFAEETIHKCLSDALKLLPSSDAYLTFTFNRIEIKIMYSDILYLHSDNHYTRVVDRTGKEYHPYIYYASLSAPLRRDKRFLQVSRGILCNMDHITGFTDNTCTLEGGYTVPITMRNTKKLQQAWHDYTFSKLHRMIDDHNEI